METGNISIDDVIKLLQSGGNVALILGIWFGGRVLAAVKKVVGTFEQIAIDVAHVRRRIDQRYPEGHDNGR
jgi:hypothetical protein